MKPCSERFYTFTLYIRKTDAFLVGRSDETSSELTIISQHPYIAKQLASVSESNLRRELVLAAKPAREGATKAEMEKCILWVACRMICQRHRVF